MKKIKIFVAGSTQLKEERKELASLVSYMNSKYERHGVNIIFATHETLGNEQAEYNDFIKLFVDAESMTPEIYRSKWAQWIK